MAEATQVAGLQTLLPGFVEFLNSIESTSLTALLITATLTLVLRIGKSGWDAWSLRREQNKKKEKASLDLLIYMDFCEDSVRKICSEDAIDRIKKLLEKEPDIKFYTEIVKEEYIFEEFKNYRHDLRKFDMVRADKFISQAKLFELYYAKLSTDEFKILSKDRKMNVIDALKDEGHETVRLAQECRASNYFQEILYRSGSRR